MHEMKPSAGSHIVLANTDSDGGDIVHLAATLRATKRSFISLFPLSNVMAQKRGEGKQPAR